MPERSLQSRPRGGVLVTVLLFAVVGALSLLLASWGPWREPGAIILFIPLLWGYLHHRFHGMLACFFVAAVLRIAHEVIFMEISFSPAGVATALTEAMWPILLYAALGVMFLLHRRRTAELTLQLVELESRTAAARLADALAHDFNNLLTVINGTAQVMAQDQSLDSQARDDVRSILDAGRQGAALVDQMRAVGRRSPIEPEPCELNEVLTREVRLLDRLTAAGVHVELIPCSQRLPVRLDVAQFRRVLQNITDNAAKAMNGGGAVRLFTNLKRETGAPDRATLRIEDQGEGIPREELESIFRPEVSTRAAKGGTGMGLFIARSIVSEHGGEIAAENLDPHGARFTVTLPLHLPASPNAEPGTD